ncbi:MAG: DUF1289 domain-containing protein [Methylococcaceae bacterium]|nr:DUF1289 domain-containing protein [Methylococcaceae bacterium]
MSSKINSVESPCIRNCCLDEDDVCLGCFRTLEEIKCWSIIDHSAKREILENASIRAERSRLGISK